MPHHVQPRSLQALCIARAALMVSHTCRAIDKVADLEGARAYLLSLARPLYDCVFDAVDRRPLSPFGIGVFLSLAIHDRVTSLNLGPAYLSRLIGDTALYGMIGNLANLVVLHAGDVRLTGNMLKAICRTCSRLEKIEMTCDSRYASLSSLRSLWQCEELRHVKIRVNGWASRPCEPHLTALIAGLPKLEVFRQGGFVDMGRVLSALGSPTRLRELEVGRSDAARLARVVRLCPRATHVRALVGRREEGGRMLAVLAESSLRLETLRLGSLRRFADLARLLELKGGNLTELSLQDCKGGAITLEDVHTIGSNCPTLEDLAICKSPSCMVILLIRHGPPPPPPPARPMFRRLVRLRLDSAHRADSRILLCIVAHAQRLGSVSTDAAFSSGRADLLCEMLDAGPMADLRALTLTRASGCDCLPVSTLSLRRLLLSCRRLRSLRLEIPLAPDAYAHVERLRARVARENWDLEIHTQPVPDYPDDLSDSEDDYDSSASDDDSLSDDF